MENKNDKNSLHQLLEFPVLGKIVSLLLAIIPPFIISKIYLTENNLIQGVYFWGIVILWFVYVEKKWKVIFTTPLIPIPLKYFIPVAFLLDIFEVW